MFQRTRAILIMAGLCTATATMFAQAPPCPGFDPNKNTNLACEIATADRGSTAGTRVVAPTLAAELSQLPTTTAISGTGLTFSKSLAVFTAANDSLGTILTQRGDTLGRHRFFASFNYQRFTFDSVDGISLKRLNTVNEVNFSSAQVFRQAQSRIDFRVDQFTAVGSFGLTDRLDVFLLVPFSKVTLKTSSVGHEFDLTLDNKLITDFFSQPSFLAGSATGLGDIAVDLKANVMKLEHASIAVGGEVRFPTGDATNYLGSGAYGVKPYFVFSRNGRFTPNINLGYQWNGSSVLATNPVNGANQNLPSSFLYSGGVDYRVVRRLTLTAEFLGQLVLDGPRLQSGTHVVAGNTFANVTPISSNYTMDNLGLGFKVNPYKNLVITGNTLIQLDSAGIRSKIVPLFGVSYRFNR